MNNKLRTFWTELNQNIVVNKRELFLGVTTCALAGALVGTLFGMILGPTITMTIGSNNGNSGGLSEPSQDSSAVPCEEEAAE